jgi:dextranase
MKLCTFYFLLAIIIPLSCDAKEQLTTEENISEIVKLSIPKYKAYEIGTDKSSYNPGETVKFDLETKIESKAKVVYKYLNDRIDSAIIQADNWTWQTPNEDFKAYTIELYSDDVLMATAAVDVSSDWTRFPRYGFLSDYSNLDEKVMEDRIQFLKNYHINAIQFYDWHNKHHKPLPVITTQPASEWVDIINKKVYFKIVKKYIELTKLNNIASMFYNLIYGAWDNANQDGVKEEWYLFKNSQQATKDYHPLSSPFLSNIYLLNPANEQWQNYIIQQNSDVYRYLDFDGFHMDQLGDRGNLYNASGTMVDLTKTFKPFINSVKVSNPNKHNVLNAVGQYGQSEIAKSEVSFLYTEVWPPMNQYDDLITILNSNNAFSQGTKNSVLACYMNYAKSSSPNIFNTASVLLTNAVIFSFGGAHLELGEHMLGNEYFPNNNLKMSEELKNKLRDYYDFLVGYQNLLRDGAELNKLELELESEDSKVLFSYLNHKKGAITYIPKIKNNTQIVHLINMLDATHTYWRDDELSQPEPQQRQNIEVKIKANKFINKVWFTSPDKIGGASFELNFIQKDGYVYVTIPFLKYWDMIVLE